MAKRGRGDAVRRAASERSLWAAWSRVAAGSGMPGVDGVGLERFSRVLAANLRELGELLRNGGYRAQPLQRAVVRRGGQERVLGVPTVRDRVAQRALLEALRKQLDTEQAEVSFAYRRGRSWLDALRRAERCRDEGLRWVFRGDVRAYFDEIDHERLGAGLDDLLRDARAVEVLMQWASAPLLTSNGLVQRGKGVPQGAPISPALANHYLTQFDAAIEGRHGRLIRYADDLAVFCPTEEAAHHARWDVERGLASLGLRLNDDKTYVSHFDRGFAFLGWVFFRGGGFEEAPNERWTHPLSLARERGGPVRR